jgi:hypothetical protein
MATPFPACPHEPATLRSSAEDMLREMAFVLHVTLSLKQAIIDEQTAPGTMSS